MRLAAPVEAAVDTVAARIEALGGHVAAARFRATRGAVEASVDAVAATVEPVLRAVAALIEPVLDAVAAAVGALGGVRPSLRGAHEQPQAEPYCAAFHRSASLAKNSGSSLLTTGLVRERR